jgi:hypothetical protein
MNTVEGNAAIEKRGSNRCRELQVMAFELPVEGEQLERCVLPREAAKGIELA